MGKAHGMALALVPGLLPQYDDLVTTISSILPNHGVLLSGTHKSHFQIEAQVTPPTVTSHA
jgi:hypothetical protein